MLQRILACIVAAIYLFLCGSTVHASSTDQPRTVVPAQARGARTVAPAQAGTHADAATLRTRHGFAPARERRGGAADAAGRPALLAVQRADAGGPPPVSARHQGGLYRISGKGRVAYLLGTVHVGGARQYPLAPEAARALAGASRVVVELDVRDNEKFTRALRKHGSYPAGDDVRRHLTPATLARLTDALHEDGISLASMAQLKPWLLANVLVGLALERSGLYRSHGVEQALLAAAARRGAPVAWLESADYQLGLYDTMDDVESERYLRECLDDLADGAALRRARAIIGAWSSGDAAALDALLPAATGGGSAVADFTRRVLLGRRNPEMAWHIEKIMRDNSVTFIGVGLLHLLGANGLPELLAQRGYLVERVY